MFRKKTPSPPSAPAAAVSDAGPCQKALQLRVGSERIAPVRAAVLEEFRKDTTLAGFRKGKAPAEIVERHYAKPIQEETLQRVMRQAFQEAATTHRLKPVGPFEVGRADFSETDGLMLEATVEVEPSFPLGAYKGIPLTRSPVGVSAQDIEQALAKLQASSAQLVPSKEGEAKERQLPAIDDEWAKDVGFETLQKLKEHAEAKLLEQQRAAQQQAVESALYEALLARHTFDLPARLVSHQTERLTRDFTVRLLLSGMPEEQVKERLTQFTDQLRQAGERHVKLGFICDRIADQESIAVTQDELVGRLWQLARRWNKDPAEVRKTLDAQGLWPSVVSTIRQEKTMAMLLAHATINETTPPKEESA